MSNPPDHIFIDNSDWDPTYLANLFHDELVIEEGCGMMELLNNSMDDTALLNEVLKLENVCGPYMPVTEDISMDDDTLLSAVNSIVEK